MGQKVSLLEKLWLKRPIHIEIKEDEEKKKRNRKVKNQKLLFYYSFHFNFRRECFKHAW